ncbi:hypothetical protein STEG23_004154, partial [Scotinomys teguina]
KLAFDFPSVQHSLVPGLVSCSAVVEEFWHTGCFRVPGERIPVLSLPDSNSRVHSKRTA